MVAVPRSLSPRVVDLRRRVAARVVDTAYESLARVSGRLGAANPELHGLERIRDIRYREGDDPAHALDVYRPRGSQGLRPVAFYVHGGAFRALSKDTHWLMGLIFARRGYVCFNVNYRLAPAHRFPAAIEDVCRAYRWVVENAARFGGDAERMVVSGESAGANLAAALAVATSYARPEPWAREVFDTGVRPIAAAPVCGVLQVTDPQRFSRRRRLPTWLRDQLEHCAEGYLPEAPDALEHGTDLADPLVIIERQAPDRPLPPFFAAVGTRDPLLDDSRRLKTALDRLEVPCRVRYYPGELHAFHALIWRRSARDCWRELFDFIGDARQPAGSR